MNIRYRVELSQTERDELKALLSGGRHAARLRRAIELAMGDEDGRSLRAMEESGQKYVGRTLVVTQREAPPALPRAASPDISTPSRGWREAPLVQAFNA